MDIRYSEKTQEMLLTEKVLTVETKVQITTKTKNLREKGTTRKTTKNQFQLNIQQHQKAQLWAAENLGILTTFQKKAKIKHLQKKAALVYLELFKSFLAKRNKILQGEK